jgi:hypothetical protein
MPRRQEHLAREEEQVLLEGVARRLRHRVEVRMQRYGEHDARGQLQERPMVSAKCKVKCMAATASTAA